MQTRPEEKIKAKELQITSSDTFSYSSVRTDANLECTACEYYKYDWQEKKAHFEQNASFSQHSKYQYGKWILKVDIVLHSKY